MSSPVPQLPSSPFTPRSRRLSNPNSPASNHATPKFPRQSPYNRHAYSSPSATHAAPLASNPIDEFGLDDDNDDDLISTVGGGVYIDEDIDMHEEDDEDTEGEGDRPGDVTGFSELDADMMGGMVGRQQTEVPPSSSQLSGGGVSVSGGIIEEEDEEDEDQDTGTELMEREGGMSPVQTHTASASVDEAIASPSAVQRPQTPTRSSIAGSPTPRAPSSVAHHGRHSRASSRSSVFSMISPTSPGRHAAGSSSRSVQDRDQTPQLLLDDFTTQFNAVNNQAQQPHTPSHHHTLQNHHHSSRGSISGLFSPQPSKSRSETAGTPSRRSTAGTPDMNNRFLIDFDIPPPPTPKSIPSVTLREVEKLKSEFLIQLGEFKAQLSGRDAEVMDLRESLREAEGRCGDLREEVETLEQGKADAEAMLAQFREQAQAQFDDARREWDEERQGVVRDADEARGKFEAEIEMVREQFGEVEQMMNAAIQREEQMKQELEAARKEIETARVMTPAPAYTPVDPNANRPTQCANCMNGGGGSLGNVGASKEEVDKIAKELHVLYKQKHETKVAALKKSYEQRWEKKVKALETEIEKLKATPPAPSPSVDDGESTKLKERIEDLVHQVEGLEAECETFKAENENLKAENEKLQSDVERERREKGELVGAVEEMLALQMQTLSEAVTAAAEEELQQQQQQQQQEAAAAATTTTTTKRPNSRTQSSQAAAAPATGAGAYKSSGLAKPGTLKVKDVKKLEKGWEGVRRRASGIGITPIGGGGGNEKAAGAGAGVSGIAPPRQGAASGLAQPRAGGASALRGGIDRMGRGAGPTGDR